MLQSQSVSLQDAVRWQRALDRALANALDVLIEPISGEAFVESATKPGTLYQVSATSCSCTAGQKGFPCQHRACYLAQIGELPLPGNEPAIDIRPGDYLDVRSCTMVTIARDGARLFATWHDGHNGRWGIDSAPLLAEMIADGILSPVAIVRVPEPASTLASAAA